MTTPRLLNTVVGAIVPSKSVHYVLYIYYTYAKLIANSVQLVVKDEMQLPPTECGLGRFVQVQITKSGNNLLVSLCPICNVTWPAYGLRSNEYHYRVRIAMTQDLSLLAQTTLASSSWEQLCAPRAVWEH